MAGRTVRIVFVDGDPTGLRTVEIEGSPLRAVVAPRSALGTLAQRPERNRPGLYLLLGSDAAAPSGVRWLAGDSDSVVRGLLRRDAGKAFWHTAAIFVSVDRCLTVARARRVTTTLTAMASVGRRAERRRSRTSKDDTIIDDLVSQIRLVLGTIGGDVLPRPAAPETQTSGLPAPRAPFTYRGEGFHATMTVTPVGFSVAAGSRARKHEIKTLPQRYRELRRTLVETRVLVDRGMSLEFTADYAFGSPSVAAVVVSGQSTTGYSTWKHSSGATYGDWLRRQIDRERP